MDAGAGIAGGQGELVLQGQGVEHSHPLSEGNTDNTPVDADVGNLAVELDVVDLQPQDT